MNEPTHIVCWLKTTSNDCWNLDHVHLLDDVVYRLNSLWLEMHNERYARIGFTSESQFITFKLMLPDELEVTPKGVFVPEDCTPEVWSGLVNRLNYYLL